MVHMSLEPEISAFLESQVQLNLPPIWEMPISQARANSQLRFNYIGAKTELAEIRDTYIPGPTADLHIRIYRPSHDDSLPAMVFFHGGGWALGFIDLYDPCLSYLAKSSGCIIIAVNYQKAPEHPFPTPLEDCYATLEWVIANSEKLGVDPEKIGIGGDSAGANLAAGVAIKARDNKVLNLKFQMLIYPCLANDFSTPSYIEYSTGYGLTTQSMKWFWNQYLHNEEDQNNPYACPMRAQDHTNLAPAILVTAQFDPLTSDSNLYAEILKRANVHVDAREFSGMIHGFFTLLGITQRSYEALEYCSERIKEFIR